LIPNITVTNLTIGWLVEKSNIKIKNIIGLHKIIIFGWEIEPINEEDWRDITEEEFNQITSLVEECLYKHKTENNI
jgi:hypothetical protein